MNFLAYFAVLIASTLILRALAPKIRHPMPALEDFQVPTAEVGRPIPWLFGTRKIKDPNIIWYGDLDRHVQTKDGAKFYTYYMGLHLEICIGPVDAVYTFWYGDKVCWEGEATDSGLIQIEQPGLYGGQYKEGGIDGAFNLLFGKPTQPVNNYLEAQIGLPLSAFRDSFTIVARQPALVANATYIKPLMPLVKRIKKGWPDDTCWYPETAEIMGSAVSSGEWLYNMIMDYGPALFARFEDTPIGSLGHMNGAVCANLGSGPDGAYDVYGWPAPAVVSDGVQSIAMWDSGGVNPSGIHFPEDTSYSYATNDVITITCKIRTDSDFASTAEHYIWHEGDHGVASNQGLGVYLYLGGGSVPDELKAIYFWSGMGVFVGATIQLPDQLLSNSTYVLQIEISRIGGSNGTGYISARIGCGGAHVGTASFPAVAVPSTAGSYGTAIGGVRSLGTDLWQIHAAIDNFAIFPRSLTEHEAVRLAEAYCNRFGYDMNPAHIIYNVWVDTHQGMAEAVASIDADAMAYAADIFYAEQLGLSLYWARQSKISDFIGEVCRHAGALQTINPRTGQLKIVALRDDYDIGTLDLLTEDDVIEVVDWQDAADGEAVNTITVKYVDRDGITQSVTYTDRAAVAQFGVIAETRDYPGIAREDLALRIAKRDVKESSSNLSKGKIKVNRIGWDKFPGAVFKFSHGPEGIDEIIVRVLEIDGGTLTDGAITLTVVQDVFSLPLTVQIAEQGGEWVAPDTAPIAATAQDVFEAPYWQLRGSLGVAETASLDEAAGYVVACAGKPNAVTTEYNIWSRINPAAYAETGTGHVTQPTGTLTAALDQQTTASIALTNPLAFAQIAVGWIARIGTGAAAEFARVTAVDGDAYTVDLDRGVLDTTPQSHALGARVFFLDGIATEWPRDLVEHTDAETVTAKLQMASHAGEISIDAATEMPITLASRQIRPYPPGNVQINGAAWPTTIDGTLTVTWAHRDRVGQGGTIITQDDAADYGPEATTTYNAYAYADSDDTLLDSDTGISGTTWSPAVAISCVLRIEIEAERDTYTSWQRQVRAFDYLAPPARLVVSGDARETVDGKIRDTTG